MAGIAIASDTPAPPLTSSLQGSPTVTLKGSLWLPHQILDMQGNPSLTIEGLSDRLVVYGLDMQGNPDLVVRANETEMAGIGAGLRLIR
jgi:hypothetical protein